MENDNWRFNPVARSGETIEITDKITANPLKSTVSLMLSDNYKERFIAEYLQTKVRYDRLKAFNNKIEAAMESESGNKRLDSPAHDCPLHMLCDQQRVMGEYLHILEIRAVIEGIDLPGA